MSVRSTGSRVASHRNLCRQFFCHLFSLILCTISKDHRLYPFLFQRQAHGFCRSCTYNHFSRILIHRKCDSQYWKIGLCISVCQIHMRCRCLFDNQANKNVIIFLPVCKFFQRNHSTFVQFHIRIHCQKAGQNIGKAKSPENTASHGRKISKLYTHDVSDALLNRTLTECIQSFMQLQLPQSCHTSN